MNEGWIKISRKITEHWLYTDAERLGWWVDLLLMANWKDTEILAEGHKMALKRGQMIASVAFLSKRWNRNAKTILSFLQLLTKEDMIIRSTVHRQTAIITICNYEIYQASADTLTETLGESKRETLVQTLADTLGETNRRNKEINNNLSKKENPLKGVKEKRPSSPAPLPKVFRKPSLEEIQEYCRERGNSVDPQTFRDFYESKGWRVGSQPMKDWKASVRTWEKRDNSRSSPQPKTKSAGVRKFFDSSVTKYDDEI